MTQQIMTRLAMVLQNQAPSTLEKYIYKLAENVLIESKNGFTLIELEQEIYNKFNLSFTIDEIKASLNKRNNKGVKSNGERYYLDERIKDELSKQETITDILHKYVLEFIKQYPNFNKTSTEIEEVLINYLYFCFNSNVNNLLMLLNKKDDKQLFFSDNIAEDDINIINSFISWENNEKNEFIYSIVTICYEYCMLTVKNDNVFSKELFKGKKFYLDSNIIFRMSGINKEERKFATDSFVKQCKKIGIKICCSSVTFDEIFRVLESQVNYIKGNYSYAPPVSPEVLSKINPYYEVNDFYVLYYDWCQVDGNHYKDFNSFYEYLLDLVRSALEKVDVIQTPKEKYIEEKNFNDLSKSLRDYKNSHNTWHSVSKVSSDTDIINIKEINNKRIKNQESIWQVNEFIVSADQQLIAWATDEFSGVPLVVLPSVWLSIILKFTGRSNSDDYNSFCLFLTQRQHKGTDNQIDPILLIAKINIKTTKIDIRERIIEEITKHKNDYSFNDDDDYSNSIDRAFDKVVEQVMDSTQQTIGQMKEQLDTKLEQLANESKERFEQQEEKYKDQIELEKITEREKTIFLLSQQKVLKKVKKYRWISKNKWIYYFVGAIIIIFGLAIGFFKIQPIWNCLVSSFEARFSDNQIMAFWGMFSVILTLISTGIIKLLESLGSIEHEEKLIKHYEAKNKKIINSLRGKNDLSK
jgi:hypothetical protein